MGGDFNLGKAHLERAMEIAPTWYEHRVIYAEWVLAPEGKREDFLTLLQSVLDAPEVGGYQRLSNRLAVKKAQQLMQEVDKRF